MNWLQGTPKDPGPPGPPAAVLPPGAAEPSPAPHDSANSRPDPGAASPLSADGAPSGHSPGFEPPLSDDVWQRVFAAALEHFRGWSRQQAELAEWLRLQAPRLTPATSPSADSPPQSSPLLPPLAESIATRLDSLQSAQGELRDLFDTRLRSDEVQAKALERLHDELRLYRANFVRQEMSPLLKDVIFAIDFIDQQLSRIETETAAEPLRILRQMLVDILFKYDVEEFRADGPAFDPRTQQSARVVPTTDPLLDRTIAHRGAAGFRTADTVIRREQVSVYKVRPAGESPARDEPGPTRETPE